MLAVRDDHDGGGPARRAGSAEQATAAGAVFAAAERLGTVDSTNRYLMDAAERGEPEGLAVVAQAQTEGRARLGRRWTAPDGSALLCSFLFRPRLAADRFHLLTLVVALAARDACWEVAGVRAGLKWPNDLQCGNLKLAGILGEVQPGPGLTAVVVGIGLNVSWPGSPPPGVPTPGVPAARRAAGSPDRQSPAEPAGLRADPELEVILRGATSLEAASGAPVDREHLLARLLAGVSSRYAGLGDVAGERALLSDYRGACATIGRSVRVELADATFTGVAVDVNDQGHLLVQGDVCLREVAAGDVVHVRPH